MAYGASNAVAAREAARAIPEAKALRDKSQVQSQMERSASLADELKSSVEKLEMHLASVLRDQGPEQGECSQAPILVGHAVALSNHNDQLTDVLARVRSIIDRLEL